MKREQVMPQAMVDLAGRVAGGAKEYGEPLTTGNGRDALQDAYEEALDLALYLKQAIMEREAGPYALRGDLAMVYGAGSASKAPPAVSESAAGEWPNHPNGLPDMRYKIRFKHGYLGSQESKDDGSAWERFRNGQKELCANVAPPDWPGPDWSQAPEGSIGWVAQDTSWPSLSPALWVFGPGKLAAEGWWNTDAGYRASVKAPLFNYPGHWRDSLRKRPSGGAQ